MEIIKIEGKALPFYSWCSDIEEGALNQIRNAVNHPIVKKHVAIMPDCHQGYGVPIGTVLACNKYFVIPNAVGVDIGCGVAAVKTTLKAVSLNEDTLKKIMGDIREQIPTGMNWHKEKQDWAGFDKEFSEHSIITKTRLKDAAKQIGTLGGGNHFIEIQKDEYDSVWIMLHSGSRNFGKKIAEHYHDKALEYCTRQFMFYDFEGRRAVLSDKELPFLSSISYDGEAYLNDMKFALEFAKANRDLMLTRIKSIFYNRIKCNFEEEYNIHHNYASFETHFGEEYLIHRKGATSARKDEIGIIPGSMGTNSYIVRGLGNKDSFTSCSHGAGRVMSRMKASKTLSLEECDKAMEGVIFGRWRKSKRSKKMYDFGEAPQAYKDIDNVMLEQKDLVTPIVKLSPIAVIKE